MASTEAPRGLRAAAIIALIEGAALVAYGLYVLVQVARLGITGPAPVSSVQSVTLEIIIFLFLGAGLLVAGWGLWRVRRWGRAPAVLGQLLGLIVGVPLVGAVGSVERIAGIAVVIMSIGALVCLFLPSTTRALVEE
ncbi:MAG: hypothetical protein B7C55_14265 [Actinomycetales bacterium mxb001]|nr:MAG: hypothetical protein B7C55_14265 [Actinomycetales bacterium mxb001]